MAVLPTDIKFYLTGGVTNTDPNRSLGGATSSTQIGSNLHNIFDYISATEAEAGDVEYRAIAVKNTSAETLYDAFIWISKETTSPSTTIAIGLDSGTQTIPNESTAPNNPAITFSTPLSKATGISLGNIADGDERRIWLRRTVMPGATAATDSGELTVGGGTAD